MSVITTAPAPAVESDQACAELETRWAQPAVAFTQKPKGRVQRAAERGMVTAEYAIGILCAIALALVIFKFVTGAEFAGRFIKLVGEAIGRLAEAMPKK